MSREPRALGRTGGTAVLGTDGRVGRVATCRAAVDDGRLPGFAAVVGRGRRVLAADYAGRLGRDGGAVTTDTQWDLASLTKVVATTPVVLRLIERGHLSLRMPVEQLLPGWDKPRPGPRVVDLLTHTAGLPVTAPVDDLQDADAFEEWLAGQTVRCTTGVAVYSDIGMVLLARLASTATGRAFEELVEQEVVGPLGLVSITWTPTPGLVASTDEPGRPSVGGAVHDELARLLRVPTGHAGLFASIADVVRLVLGWSGERDTWLTPATRRLAMRCWTHSSPRHRGLGWVTRGDAYDCLSQQWGGSAVSHTGFTGTSVALDPATSDWAVLLTNAVHHGRERSPMVTLRRAFHDEAARLLADAADPHDTHSVEVQTWLDVVSP